jgi:hypothetical protein
MTDDRQAACAAANRAHELDPLLVEVLGAVLAAERKRHRKEIEKLKAVLELRIDGLQRELAKERSVRGGDVVDLPAGLLRKRHDNAA